MPDIAALLSIDSETKSILFSYMTLIISIAATFLSANQRMRTTPRRIFIFLMFATPVAITRLIYPQMEGWPIYTALILLIVVFIVYFGFFNPSGIISRRKIDKMIRKFTAKADYTKDIKLFGGDLNFFGEVANGSIDRNKQLNQLIKMNCKKIHILCIKPEAIDSNSALRIGYLREIFDNKIRIKFYNEKTCSDCDFRDDCFACNVCDSCDRHNCEAREICKYTKGEVNCPYLNQYKTTSCYNPDLSIRGRIIMKNHNSSESAAIFIKYIAGKKYIIREYNSEDKECKMYSDIWDVWWKKCKEETEFQEECTSHFRENRDSFQGGRSRKNFLAKYFFIHS